ncbi:MAG TPA: flagellar hook-associated protein FlgK [Acidimicrobiales bacterium]|nr:flagellar hook-associated protein FlgK [Acidimicrobiales bacterium]
MSNIALWGALSGLESETAAMNATSNNVANVNTSGYLREAPQFSSLPQGGVLVAGIDQVTSGLQMANTLAASSSSASATAYQTLMNTAQSAFPEPGSNGLQAQLSSFWSSWDDVANDPSQLASRTQVTNLASNLASSLNQAAAKLSSLQQTSATQVSAITAQVNNLLGQVATLNKAVVAAGPGGAGNSLIDQRNQLVDTLAGDLGINVATQADGSINIYAGGLALVQGGVADTLSVANSGGAVSIVSAHTGGPVPVTQGTIGGLLQGINQTIPVYQGRLDQVAADLASTVNAQQAAGQTQSGVSGPPIFVATGGGAVTAASITVNPAVTADPTLLAAAAPGAGSLDGSNAQAMAELASSATGPDQSYRILIGDLGSDVQAASSLAATQSAFSQQATAANQAISGVNTDEEMVKMLSYQQGYQAAAKVITTVDNALQSLMAAV